MTIKDIHTHTHTYNNHGSEIPLFTKIYDLYSEFSDSLPTFPKSQRFALGQRIENTILDLLEFLFTIPFTKEKSAILEQMSVKTDLLKVLLRLAKDTKALSFGKYAELQATLQEIGKMLGGWIRATRTKET